MDESISLLYMIQFNMVNLYSDMMYYVSYIMGRIEHTIRISS